MNASQYYEAGDIDAAIDALNEEVKNNPTDQNCRGFLCEMLCFAGNLDRADRLLETILHQTPEAAVGISLFRQLIRAEQARQQFYQEGRAPELLAEAGRTASLELVLQASIAVREQKPAEAEELVAQAAAKQPAIQGSCDGEKFAAFRDLDDLLAPVFEVLTSTGKFYLIPASAVELVEFHAPERPRDLLWRRAHMIVAGGPDGEVFIPALYPNSASSEDNNIRLGRATEWLGGEGSPVRGMGQRIYLVGDRDLPIMGLNELQFEPESA